jgi:hypothetical protein
VTTADEQLREFKNLTDATQNVMNNSLGAVGDAYKSIGTLTQNPGAKAAGRAIASLGLGIQVSVDIAKGDTIGVLADVAGFTAGLVTGAALEVALGASTGGCEI